MPGRRSRQVACRLLDYVCIKPTDCMVLDDATKTNLELLQTLLERKRQGALLGVLDQTKTAMGGRLLRSWLLQPLLDLDRSVSATMPSSGWSIGTRPGKPCVRCCGAFTTSSD
jgi:hypothetical protein